MVRFGVEGLGKVYSLIDGLWKVWVFPSSLLSGVVLRRSMCTECEPGGPGGTKPVMGHVLFRVSRVRDLRLRVCLRFPLKIVGSGI